MTDEDRSTTGMGPDDPLDRLADLGRSMAQDPPVHPTTREELGRRARALRRRRAAAFGSLGAAALLVGVLALPGTDGDGDDRVLDVTGPTPQPDAPEASPLCDEEFWHPDVDVVIYLAPDAADGLDELEAAIEQSGDTEVVHRVDQDEAHRRFTQQLGDTHPELVRAVQATDLPPSLEIDVGPSGPSLDEVTARTWAQRPEVLAVTARDGSCGPPLFDGIFEPDRADSGATTATSPVSEPR